MKRNFHILIAMLLAVVAVAAHAETRYKSHVSVGAHGGASLSSMTFSPSVSQSMLPGATVGVSFRYAEERHVGLLAELNFSQRGWKDRFDESELRFSRTLNYLEVPVMTHVFFGSKRFLGFVNLGPQVSLFIGDSRSGNFDYDHPLDEPQFPSSTHMSQQMTEKVAGRIDYGIVAGVGGEYYITPRQSVTLEARFYFGLGNVFADSRKDPFSASRAMSIQLTAGWNFRVK